MSACALDRRAPSTVASGELWLGRAVAREPVELNPGGGVGEGVGVDVGLGLGLGESIGVAPAVGDAVDVPPEQPTMATATSRPPRPSPATCESGLQRSWWMPDRRSLKCVGDWIVAGASL